MQRKLTALIFTLAVIFAFYACTLPTAIEIKGSPHLDIPISLDSANISDFFVDIVKESNIEDVEILDYTAYKNASGKNIQALLFHYPMTADLPADYTDGLDSIDQIKFDFTADDLSQEIDCGDLGDINELIPAIDVELDLTDFFKIIDDKIQDGFSGVDIIDTPKPIYIGDGIKENRKLTDNGKVSVDGFNEVTFGGGKIKATIKLDETVLSDVKIKINKITLDDGTNQFESNSFYLDEFNSEEDALFVLAYGKKLINNFDIYLDYEDESTTSPRFIDIKLTDITIEDLLIKEASGIKIDPADIAEIEIPAINEPIDFAAGSIFVHAKIESGKIEIDNICNNDPVKTRFINFNVNPDINIIQAVLTDPDAIPRNGLVLNGSELLYSDNNSPWEFSLNNKEINTNNIRIDANSSKITLTANDGGFWFSDADMNSKKTTIKIVPSIESFSIVHVNIDNELETSFTNDIDLSDQVEFLELIKFEKIGPLIEFGEVTNTDPPLGIKITAEPNLGINPGGVYKKIEDGGTADFINYSGTDFEPANDLPTGELKFNVDIKFIDGSNNEISPAPKVIGILGGPSGLRPSDAKFIVEVADLDFAYEWTEAKIDLSSLVDNDSMQGDFPGSGDGIDFSAIFENFPGFTFTGIDARLYTSGPATLFNLKPEITVTAKYTGIGDPIIILGKWDAGLDKVVSDEIITATTVNLELDPNNTGEYKGPWPLKDDDGINISSSFNTILNKGPKDLTFHYEGKLGGTITVSKNDLLERKSVDADKLSVDIFLMIPFSLKAGADAAIVFPNMFEDKDDLFDREVSDDSSILDWIKKLSLKIELSDELFTKGEGKLYMKDTLNSSAPLIAFPLSGKSLNVNIKGADLDYINKTVPYKPEIGIRFDSGAEIQIPYNLSLTRIVFDADISYKIDLQE